MTWAQLIFAIITLSAKAFMKIGMFIYLVIFTFFRFGYYLMTPNHDELEVEQAALPMPERLLLVNMKSSNMKMIIFLDHLVEISQNI